jgi:holliday junction DNA helicase ruvA
MIAYLKGIFTELTPTAVIIECSGVGYHVSISLSTYTALSSQKEGKVLITEIIREDAHLLFGFATQDEQELFRHLMSVSGVGPNTARIILSSYPPHELNSIITLGQIEPLKAIKGIGLKTAQRILVDLRGKLPPMEQVEHSEGTKAKPSKSHPVQSLDTTTPQEAISALKMLGYPEAAAQKVVRQLIATTPTIRVEELIKQSLKLL